MSVGVKNVGRDPNCTSLGARLLVDRGYEYGETPVTGFWRPRTGDMLPGEETGGNYVFEAHDGTRPATVIFERIGGEQFCAESQHRRADMSGGKIVRIPLRAPPAVGTKVDTRTP